MNKETISQTKIKPPKENNKIIGFGTGDVDGSCLINYALVGTDINQPPTGQFPLTPGQQFEIGDKVQITREVENEGRRITYGLTKIDTSK